MGTAVVDGLVERLGLAVAADNDVLAHGMGEAWRGACRGARSAVVVAAGTGVGAAFLVDGRPWHGARSAAGHVDNLAVPEADGVPCRCGRTGHVEAVATGPGCTGCTWPVAATRRRSTRCGPPVGRWTAGRALGRGIGGLANAVDPEVVVVGGGLAGAGPLWWDAVTEAVDGELIDALEGVPVVPSQLGVDAAMLGAARLAFDLIDEPLMDGRDRSVT